MFLLLCIILQSIIRVSLQGTNVIFIDSYYEDDINICIKIHNKKFITTGNVKMKKTHLLKLFCEKGSLIICYSF